MNGHSYIPTWRTVRDGSTIVTVIYCAVCGHQHNMAELYRLVPQVDTELAAA